MINLETIKTHIEEQLKFANADLVVLDRVEAGVVYGILAGMISRLSRIDQDGKERSKP